MRRPVLPRGVPSTRIPCIKEEPLFLRRPSVPSRSVISTGAVATACVVVTTVLSAQNYSARVADARGQLASRHVDSAVTLLQSVTRGPGVDATVRSEAFMWLGVAVFYQGQDSSARANLREALRYDPLLLGAEPLHRLDSALADWWEREQTLALCGEALPAWGWPTDAHAFPSFTSPMNAEARAGKAPELTGRPPVSYPDHLRMQNIQGRVLARAIVDPSGRAERGSVRILSTPHRDFNRPVSNMIEGARFSGAVSGDTPVRSCIVLPVDFSIRR